MATRSTIAIKINDNEYLSIYCHYDGFISNNGRILQEYYNTKDKVLELINLGDLSSLGEKLAPEEGVKHDFLNKAENVCVFYGRDRGEEGTNSKNNFSLAYMSHNDYNYIFIDNEWYYFIEDNYKHLHKLSNSL